MKTYIKQFYESDTFMALLVSGLVTGLFIIALSFVGGV